RDSFLFSWNATLELAEGLLVAVAGMIPGLLFLTVLGGILALLIWLAARRRGARRSPPTGGGPGPAATAANAPTAPAAGGGGRAGSRGAVSETETGDRSAGRSPVFRSPGRGTRLRFRVGCLWGSRGRPKGGYVPSRLLVMRIGVPSSTRS